MWNVKGELWNSTENILPIHCKMRFLCNIEILRAFGFKSSKVFLKRPPVHMDATLLNYICLGMWTVKVPSVLFQCRLQWSVSPVTFQFGAVSTKFFSSGIPVYLASIRWVVRGYPSVHWLKQWYSSGIPMYTGPASVHWLMVREVILSGVPDLWDRNKILGGGDLSHYQVPHCIRVFF